MCVYRKRIFFLFFVHEKIIYSRVPTRADILGKDTLHDENVNTLTKSILPALYNNLERIDNLLKQYDLDSHRKV